MTWKEMWARQMDTAREASSDSSKAERLRREAEKKDKRTAKMAKKHLRGNIRARNAAGAADNLHTQADRLAGAAKEAEEARLEARRENFRRTGSYDG